MHVNVIIKQKVPPLDIKLILISLRALLPHFGDGVEVPFV